MASMEGYTKDDLLSLLPDTIENAFLGRGDTPTDVLLLYDGLMPHYETPAALDSVIDGQFHRFLVERADEAEAYGVREPASLRPLPTLMAYHYLHAPLIGVFAPFFAKDGYGPSYLALKNRLLGQHLAGFVSLLKKYAKETSNSGSLVAYGIHNLILDYPGLHDARATDLPGYAGCVAAAHTVASARFERFTLNRYWKEPSKMKEFSLPNARKLKKDVRGHGNSILHKVDTVYRAQLELFGADAMSIGHIIDEARRIAYELQVRYAGPGGIHKWVIR
ncbi:hypothetical protein JXB02_06220 [Candidatus Woesearchaeota archaeon]|nr:hypothetical protein [Candidatus Woesearchaeota archaeon]